MGQGRIGMRIVRHCRMFRCELEHSLRTRSGLRLGPKLVRILRAYPDRTPPIQGALAVTFTVSSVEASQLGLSLVPRRSLAHRFLRHQLIQAFLGFPLPSTKAVPKAPPPRALHNLEVVPAVLVRDVMPPVLQVSRPYTAHGRPQRDAGAHVVVVQVKHVQQDRLVRVGSTPRQFVCGVGDQHQSEIKSVRVLYVRPFRSPSGRCRDQRGLARVDSWRPALRRSGARKGVVVRIHKHRKCQGHVQSDIRVDGTCIGYTSNWGPGELACSMSPQRSVRGWHPRNDGLPVRHQTERSGRTKRLTKRWRRRERCGRSVERCRGWPGMV